MVPACVLQAVKVPWGMRERANEVHALIALTEVIREAAVSARSMLLPARPQLPDGAKAGGCAVGAAAGGCGADGAPAGTAGADDVQAGAAGRLPSRPFCA